MIAAELLAELNVRGVRLTARGDRLAYDAPVGVMTAERLHLLKEHKPEILVILGERPVAPIVESAETPADRDWRRFLAVCRARPDGRGWYDPDQAATIDALAQADASMHDKVQR